MKEKFGNLILVAGLLLVLYLLVNLVHLIWYLADPEGFWGFTYFLELLRVGLFVIFIAAFGLFLTILLFSSLIASFKNGFKTKEFFKGLGILVFILTVPTVNYLLSNGPFLYITGTLANKYSHLETTQKYLNRGNIQKACEYAEKAYYKEENRGEISSFFLLTKWYALTNLDRSQRLTSRYAAIIAYGVCQKESREFDKAEMLFKDAVKISNSKLLQQENASFQSFPLMALAEIYLQRGEYYKAEEHFEHLQNFYGELQSEDFQYQIQGNMFFADRAIRVGDFRKAADIFLRNVQLFEQSSSDDSSLFYLALLVMATVSETNLENYQQAKELIKKAEPLAMENKDNVFYPNFLISKANFLYQAALKNLNVTELISRSWGEKISKFFQEEKPLKVQLLEEAEVLYKTAVAETAKKSGRKSYQYISYMRQLGEFYYNTGRYEEAANIIKIAEEFLRPMKNENPDEYISVLLASLRTEKITDYTLIKQVEDQIFHRISSNYQFLSEEEKESFISKIENQLHVLNGIYIADNSPQANRSLYNNILAAKQLALNSSRHIREFISLASEDLKKDYAQLLKDKEKLQNSVNEEEHRQLSSGIADKERRLYIRIAEQDSYSPFDPREVDWMGVRDSLRQNEVAIEMFKLPMRNNLVKDGNDLYFALVLKKEFDHPILIPLFSENQLEELLNKSGGTRERVNSIYGDGKENLIKMLWDPLSEHISASSVIYLSVSGILHNISFPALMLDQPGEFHFLGTTRDLLKLRSPQMVSRKNIVLFGDADFSTIRQNSESRSFYTVERQVKQGLMAGDFSDLKYTRQEIDTIEKIFKPTAGLLTKFVGKEASERSFRNLDIANYNILHLATHGFYFKASAPNFFQENDLLGENMGIDSPMYRSGLLLSGSNEPNSSKENDGILTAFEISKMDLSGVDLMVLSACETGRGDISGSEGVFGLQRALKLAGVKNQIVSLWQVPDKQTAELFEIFYSQFAMGNSPNTSLKTAQSKMAKKYEPFYWAGFVLFE